MEIRAGALGAGVGATAGPNGGGSGGIFCPCAAMSIGRANRQVASANPFLMSILLTYFAKRDRQRVSWKPGTRRQNDEGLRGGRGAGWRQPQYRVENTENDGRAIKFADNRHDRNAGRPHQDRRPRNAAERTGMRAVGIGHPIDTEVEVDLPCEKDEADE